MRLLIVYGTTEGHTRKIAQFLNDEAEKKGINVTLCDASNEPEPPLFFNGVIVCSSVHIQKYQSSIENYVKSYNDKLNAAPSAFCSVSLTAAGDEEKSWSELRKLTVDFQNNAGWQPQFTEYVAGALLYTKYDFFKKYIMRMISKRAGGATDTSDDFIYTDWKKLSTFLDGFIAEMDKQRDKVGAEETYL